VRNCLDVYTRNPDGDSLAIVKLRLKHAGRVGKREIGTTVVKNSRENQHKKGREEGKDSGRLKEESQNSRDRQNGFHTPHVEQASHIKPNLRKLWGGQGKPRD